MTTVPRLFSRFSPALAAAALATLAACGGDPASPVKAAPPPSMVHLHESPEDLPMLTTASSSADVSADADSASPSAFNVSFRYLTSTTPVQRATFEAAARRWQSIIVGDVPSITGTIPANFCGIGGVPAFTGTIDDILIDVIIAPIDGPGRILGQAGPCAIRNSDALPAYGIMFFDVADLDFLDARGQFQDVITHEMGHVLGFGTLWDFRRSLLINAVEFGGHDPRFVGPYASHLYPLVGGRRESVPVENLFGPGTVDSHWRESVFRNELMTGFINAGHNPLSIVSAGSMRDLGYDAVANGDPFHIPDDVDPSTRSTAEGFDIGEREILITPKGSIPGAP